MRNRKQLIYSFLLIFGVIALVNILSANFFARLDLTEDKRFTLSKATKKILKELKQPVTVTAYFSRDLPTQLVKGEKEFKEILVEYANRSKNKVVYEFVNPSANEESEQKAAQAGIKPNVVNVREKDQEKQQKIYIGAVVKVGERSEIIPTIVPGSPMEYELSAAIKKLTMNEKASIGLLQGNGEPSLAGISQAYNALDVLYNVELAYFNDTAYSLNKYKTLIVVNPKDTVPDKYLAQLDRFLQEGGNMFIAVDHVGQSPQNGMGILYNNLFVTWLKKKGVTIADNIVIDARCDVAPFQQQNITYLINFPYFPKIAEFPKHPITEGLDNITMQFASQILYSGDSSKSFVPLALTSEKSDVQNLPVSFDGSKEWKDADFKKKNLVVAAAAVPKTGKGGRIVVVSNGTFAINGEGQQNQRQRQLPPANINLMVNAIDWLSDDTGLIDLRSKGFKARMLDQIDDGKRTFLKYLNFLLPILIIIGYGIYRFNRNRTIRMKRMEARYV